MSGEWRGSSEPSTTPEGASRGTGAPDRRDLPTVPPSSRSRIARIWSWSKARPRRTVAILLLGTFSLLNVWTYRHVWAMTHYSAGGPKTLRPEELSPLDRAVVLIAGVNVPRPQNDRTPADLGLSFSVEHIVT